VISEASKNKVQVTVKWPNDVLVGGEKLCGILIEKFGDYIIIGIGVNIISSPKYLDSGRKACALNDHIKNTDSKKLLRDILINFQNMISENNKNGFEGIRTKYKYNLYKLNEGVELDHLGKKVKGIIRDISPAGSLIIEDKNGLQEYRVGEIFDI
jgi:BirA family biotin operon repressor/biotin-[acetyl-CoA-carboxylase] ligase